MGIGSTSEDNWIDSMELGDYMEAGEKGDAEGAYRPRRDEREAYDKVTRSIDGGFGALLCLAWASGFRCLHHQAAG